MKPAKLSMTPDRPPDSSFTCCQCDGPVYVWNYLSSDGHKMRYTQDDLCLRSSVIDLNLVVGILGSD